MREYFEITTIQGLRISGLASNPKADRTILALHGWLDNLNSFLPLMDELPDINVVAIDFPGHGKSDHKPTGYIYHFIDSIADTMAIVEALELEKFDLMGHSMGAGVAPLVAATVPDRVEHLICLEGFGPLSAPPEKMLDTVQAHVRQLKRLPNKKFPIYRSPEEALMARLLAGDISEDAGRLIVERALEPKEHGVTWNTDARLRIKTAHPFTEDQILAFMRGIKCPTMLIRALPGFPFNSQEWLGRRASIAQLSYHELSGNHHVHMDSPEEVGRLIREFYERT